MAQGIIGGATSYEEQSLSDVKDDILKWIEYSNKMHDFLESGINDLKQNTFWNQIPFNFQMTLLSTMKCQESFIHDFSLILDAIDNSKITERETNLLRKIGIKAIEFNNEYGRTYKEEYRWKKYGDPDFKIAEELYARERDYFVSLQDATNAASRLTDYISALPSVTYNNINQTVNGNSNVVSGINNGSIVQTTTFNEISSEISKAIEEINQLSGVESDLKSYINELLVETEQAIKDNDIEKQTGCKKNYKGLILGAGSKAFKIIGVLSSFASIASFFGISV